MNVLDKLVSECPGDTMVRQCQSFKMISKFAESSLIHTRMHS